MAYLWLTTKSRKEIMKHYGYYDGEINGVRGDSYYKAVSLVNKDFLPKKFHHEKYYKETDIVLRNLRNLMTTKYFDLKEFKCNCKGKYCSGYPTVMNKQLIDNLDKVRKKFGSTSITSGMRCKGYNDSLKGSIMNSKHTKGKAVDIRIPEVTKTLKGRQEVMKYWRTLPKAGYTYCNVNGSHPNMGTSVHIEVE